MTSRFRHNVTFAAALVCLSIAIFLAVFSYLAMSQGNTTTYRINVNNIRTQPFSTTKSPATDRPTLGKEGGLLHSSTTSTTTKPEFANGKCGKLMGVVEL